MPEKVIKRVDKYLTRILRGSDRKLEEIAPIKTKQIEVRAGEEDEPSIVVSIIEEENNEE
ncbi:hypothetical protein KAW18_01485 [candidate division WOR-3 bacterium]|nr:hypothetical protein [candidate division WOR-3 bacterium]